MERFDQFLMLKNDFKNQNFEMFEEVFHNHVSLTVTLFSEKNVYFHQMHSLVCSIDTQGEIIMEVGLHVGEIFDQKIINIQGGINMYVWWNMVHV